MSKSSASSTPWDLSAVFLRAAEGHNDGDCVELDLSYLIEAGECRKIAAFLSAKIEKNGRSSWPAMLDEIAEISKQPPKQGYRGRTIYLQIEDECDSGGEYIVSYSINQEELAQLRAIFS